MFLFIDYVRTLVLKYKNKINASIIKYRFNGKIEITIITAKNSSVFYRVALSYKSKSTTGPNQKKSEEEYSLNLIQFFVIICF